MTFSVSFEVLWRMLVSGVFFGLWPIVLKQSGFAGLSPMLVTNATAFTVLVLAVTLLEGKGTLITMAVVLLLSWSALLFAAEYTNLLPRYVLTSYVWLLIAGLLIGFGVVIFLSGVDRAAINSVHAMYTPFVIMLIAQTAVPVLFQLLFNGSGLHWMNYLALCSVPFVIVGLGYRTAVE